MGDFLPRKVCERQGLNKDLGFLLKIWSVKVCYVFFWTDVALDEVSVNKFIVSFTFETPGKCVAWYNILKYGS